MLARLPAPANSPTDHLFVGTDRYTYFTLSWDSSEKRVRTERDYVDMSDPSSRESQTGNRCLIDPSGRFMTLEIYEGVIAVIPIIQLPSKKRGRAVALPSGPDAPRVGELGEPTNTHGPLILSEFSGTAGTLSSAIHINPWDTTGVAEAINRALTMSPEEKKAQHVKLYKHVTTNTISTWSNHFVTRLLINLSSFDQSVATPALDRAKLLKQYRKARKRLFMFDYDGTLTPIVKDPQAAIPSDRVLRTLKTLAADPRNAVWIISGRDQAFLDEWMGHIPELGLSAEHGCFIRQPRSDDWENLAESSDMGWQKEVMEVFQHFTERTQGSFIERKRVALTWHYRRADPEYGAFQARECRKMLEETVAKRWEVEVMAGKANLEVRPTFVNKGFIAARLVQEYGTDPAQAPEFVLCLGDDFTDEGKYYRFLVECSISGWD